MALLAAEIFAARTKAAAPANAHPQFRAWGIDLTSMDRNVKPGDDFFLYADGAWDEHEVIPPELSVIDPLIELDLQSLDRMSAIVMGLEAKPYNTLSGEEGTNDVSSPSRRSTFLTEVAGMSPAMTHAST
jgi:predicted metalloendopeptidase